MVTLVQSIFIIIIILVWNLMNVFRQTSHVYNINCQCINSCYGWCQIIIEKAKENWITKSEFMMHACANRESNTYIAQIIWTISGVVQFAQVKYIFHARMCLWLIWQLYTDYIKNEKFYFLLYNISFCYYIPDMLPDCH